MRHTDPAWYMPNGQPAPAVMTVDEVVTLLRLDEAGGMAPALAVERYRKRGLLRGIQIGRCIRYPLESVQEFIRSKGDDHDFAESPRPPGGSAGYEP